MRIAAILPVRSLADGKRRLAGVLDDQARAGLNTAFLAHALSVAAVYPGIAATIVVSPDPAAREHAAAAGARALDDPGGGLNAALDAARKAARADGADAVIVLPVDLPRARPEDVLALCSVGTPAVIAPDRRGIGTNGLYVATALDFAFRFGEASFRAHIAEARRLGVSLFIRHSARLGFDVDVPDDWRDWQARADPAAWAGAQL